MNSFYSVGLEGYQPDLEPVNTGDYSCQVKAFVETLSERDSQEYHANDFCRSQPEQYSPNEQL